MTPERALLLSGIVAITPAFASLAQSPQNLPSGLGALRAHEPVVIDGHLSERVWQRAGETRFIQREPYEGAPPSERTEVWVCYDDEALYVAARLFDSAPDSVIGRLARRDEDSQSDQFGFALDAAHDKRTAVYFIVNPAGAIEDGTISNDSHLNSNWDAIWDVAVRIDDKGWTAEFRVLLSQLRFAKNDRYVWGIAFFRRIERRHEECYLARHPRTDAVRVSRWTELHGIEGIEPPARIEILPYIAGTTKFLQQPAVDSFNEGRDDPYKVGRDYFGNVGADAKIGLRGDVTLDVSLNPDFAQVEVDPAIVNLTAYETRFQEKRPFFIEGQSIFNFGRGGATSLQDFNWHDPNLFYSRRIGRGPQASVTHPGFRDIPDRTTILGAAKLSGKISETWSFAALTAVTDREYGNVDSAGIRFSEEIEPLTFYGILRTQKEFNDARQAIGILATSVERDLRQSRLQNVLNDRALSLGIDGWTFLDAEKDWVLTGWAGASYVGGSPSRLIALQRSPVHYFQRPEADYVEVDSTATSMTGWATRVWLDKVKGNWIFNAALGAIHPSFESNDAGFLSNADYVNMHVYAGYQWFEPDGVFLTKSATATALREFDFGRFEIGETYRFDLFGQFSNFWNSYFGFGYNMESFDDQRTRGGPLMKSLESAFLYTTLSTDSRNLLSGTVHTSASKGASGGWNFYTSLGFTWKASKTLMIRGGPDFSRNHNVAQYVTSLSDPHALQTFKRRYIFGTLDQTTLSASFRVYWTFSPKLSLQLYLQPLLSTGKYTDFKELSRPRTFSFNHFGDGSSTIRRDENVYAIDPDGPAKPASPFLLYNPNFNFKSLRANAVLRWEYLPGSTFYFVWTNEKVDYETGGEFRFGRDFSTLLRDRPDNVFSIKLTYWMNP